MEEEASKPSETPFAMKAVVVVLWLGLFTFLGYNIGQHHANVNRNTVHEIDRDGQIFGYGIVYAADRFAPSGTSCRLLETFEMQDPKSTEELKDNYLVKGLIASIRKECNEASSIYPVTPDPRTRGDNVLPGTVPPAKEGNCLVYNPKTHEPEFAPCPGPPVGKEFESCPEGQLCDASPRVETH